MLSALLSVTFKQWRTHRLRLAFTVLGIALGVSVFFAVKTANLTLLGSLKTTVEKLAGKATLQVASGESGFPEEVLDVVRETPGVMIAEPVVETLAKTAFDPPGNILIVGTDTTGDQSIREYQFDESQMELNDPLVYLSEPFSILVSRKFADRYQLKEGDKLPLYTSRGKLSFNVRGIFAPAGIGAVFDGQIAVMDVYSAQYVFGRGKNFDRIDIQTEPGVSVEQVQAALRSKLPAAIEVERPASRGKNIENVMAAMQQGMLITSYVALLVGIFIIFNSFTISVNQRWKEIGILRSLGVERRNIALMFMGEALVIGVIGSLVGIVAGLYLAQGAAKILSIVAATIFGLAAGVDQPVFRWDFAATTIVLGVLASLIAAWMPARAASQLNPVLALHNIEIRQPEVVAGWMRTLVGAILVTVAVLLVRFSPAQVGGMFQLVYSGILNFGLLLMLPKMAELIARSLRSPMDFLFGTEGALAVDAMIHAPRRMNATVGALMFGLMFVYATGSYVQSYKGVVERWMNRTINSDLFVKTTSEQVRSRSYHFSPEFSQKIATVPGVKRLENVRFITVEYRGTTPSLIALEMEGLFARTKDMVDEGDPVRAEAMACNGEGFLVARNFALRWKLKVGDKVVLDTPTGVLERPIAGIIEDYTSDQGTVFMDRALYIQFWKDDGIDIVDINLQPGVDVVAFKRELEKVISTEQQAFIYTNQEYKKWVFDLLDTFFFVIYLQTIISVLVAAIGIFNTMMISVAERKRELGVLRAIGGLRGQVRKMVLLEAVVIAIVGLVTAIFAGAFNTYILVRLVALILGGFTIPFDLSFSLIFGTLPVVVVIALIAAYWPAHRAVNLKIVEAIGYE